jgi:AAA+ ATPase superfamily predicted ATPase
MQTLEPSRKPLRVFISYARADEQFREELVRHLGPMVLAKEITILQDRDIRAGAQWEKKIRDLLNQADIVLTLVSPYFFHSTFCVSVEMRRALERAAAGEMLLVPVLARPVAWQGTDLSTFQALPTNARPISKWDDRDDAYISVAAGLRQTIEESRSVDSAPGVESIQQATAGVQSVPDIKIQGVSPPASPQAPTGTSSGLPGALPNTVARRIPVMATSTSQPAAQDSVSVVQSGAALSAAYDFTHPATEFFRGRSRELARLCRVIRGGKSAAVFGLQRVGKTSLVERAIEMADSESGHMQALTIRIDMFSQWESFKSVLDFFNVIASELAKAEGSDPASLQKLLLEAYGSSFSEYHLQDTFRGILRKSRKIIGRPIVLFIDEFQEVERAFHRAMNRSVPMAFDAGVMRWLGSLIKDRENILQLLLCCRFHAKDLEQRERMELFKLLDVIDLGPLDEPSARSLIRDPVNDSIHYDEESARRIIELTGRFPYFIQYIGYELVARQRVVRTRQVRRKDVDDCADEIVSSQINESRFSVLYEDFKTLDGGQPWKVILALASLSRTERQLIGFTELANTCRDRAGLRDHAHIREILSTLALTQLVIEQKRGPEPSYHFGPELLRRWLQQQGHIRALR